MPFGVELPENLGTPAPAAPTDAPAAPEGSPAGASPSGETSSNESKSPQTIQEILDLDKVDRFRFAGREWKNKDFQSAYLMREDYSKKTTELAEARKYVDNFAADLRVVQQDPSRMEEFKRLYPHEYVALAQQYLENGKSPATPTGNTQPTPPTDPKVAEMHEKFSKWEQSTKEAELKSIQSWLDNQYATLSKKYPFANSEIVDSRAEVAARKGTQITEQVLDKLFKANNQEIEAKWAEHYKGKVNKQIDVGKQARDMGPGGGTPSAAPVRPRTIKEATEQALQDISSRRNQ